MEKRYQVFVSSTYADLKDERQKSNPGPDAVGLHSRRNGALSGGR